MPRKSHKISFIVCITYCNELPNCDIKAQAPKKVRLRLINYSTVYLNLIQFPHGNRLRTNAILKYWTGCDIKWCHKNLLYCLCDLKQTVPTLFASFMQFIRKTSRTGNTMITALCFVMLILTSSIYLKKLVWRSLSNSMKEHGYCAQVWCPWFFSVRMITSSYKYNWRNHQRQNQFQCLIRVINSLVLSE